MNTINSINTLNFKSFTPFYYPKGKNVDRAEILAREAEWRQMLCEDEAETSDSIIDTYYGEQLTQEELESKLREVAFARSQIHIDDFTPEKDGEPEDADSKTEMPIFQTEQTLFEEKRKLDIRG